MTESEGMVMHEVRKHSPAAWVSKLAIVLPLSAFALYIVVPISWMIATTLRLPMQSFALPPALLPTEFNLDSYRMVFQKVDLPMFTWNSIQITFLSTFFQLICSSTAAFAFSRLRFPGRNAIFVLFLAALMIPAQVTNIPRFIIMSKLRLIDKHIALILPAMFNAMGIFLLRQFMMTIPKSYDEAAYMDGASRFYCYGRIVLPMTKPALMVIAVQTFIFTWNDFYGPLIYLNSNEKMTLPLGLTVLRGALNSGSQASILAGVILSLAAPLCFYIFGQRYLVEGTNLGGLKS